MGVIIKHIYDQAAVAARIEPALSETIEAVLLKGLAKPIEQRYHSAGEFAAALQLAISASPTLALSPVVGPGFQADAAACLAKCAAHAPIGGLQSNSI